ncbi:LON peptidase substrate-binding domain-containing protein [Colwellia sp. E2M01]|uniref:LON peptidase substrate-binding domain-containing protein n=1 Tax=Colwellia sp. E2M01 TaxID=2841561 RepID=UPI001C084D39|nr:LON peptidase substrate-binding domain-containing protein [Colwellia sp. E2M01]MBU2872115.1 LON peptidase substrate-binding domain-containing protein [Colwellia sp. E2M01]
MNTVETKLPIFPLPVFLLPEGITRLRIFEQRYLKMVKLASQGQGFVIWLTTQDSEKPLIKWGSWVEIINFDQGADGVLEIDVKCKSLVEILSLDKDADNLHFGKVSKIPHWSQHNNIITEATKQSSLHKNLLESLHAVLAQEQHLSQLYTDENKQDTPWVIARWLELLPVNLSVKSRFVAIHSFEDAKHFVESIIN